jgi:nicotinate phosphoribosyltransferase
LAIFAFVYFLDANTSAPFNLPKGLLVFSQRTKDNKGCPLTHLLTLGIILVIPTITNVKAAVAMTIHDSELILTPEDYSLLTDLYELTMAACYVGEGLAHKRASFELFTRHLPENFGYIIVMGLNQALDYLEKLRFTEAHIEALQSLPIFEAVSDEFWSVLANARFTGDVWAVPEGTAVFSNEPLVRVEGDYWQAQLVETYVLNAINYQTLIATRAARLRDVAGAEAKLLEFGARRAFSPQGAMWAARSAIAGGLNSTSNTLAALKLGQTPSGTMAHSLVMGIGAMAGTEDDAFRAFSRYFPTAPLLIDTYDTVEAAGRLAKMMESGELQVTGVRLDSGDIAALSQEVRKLLPDATIFASGDLDEYEIARLNKAGADIQGYGIGTRLVTGSPVNGVYKLVEIDQIPTMKQSSSKATYPGRKQVFRTVEDEQITLDRLGTADETPQTGEQPLLQQVMAQGRQLHPAESLKTISQRTADSVASLPPDTRKIKNPVEVKVQVSDHLQQLQQQVIQRLETEAS